MPFLIDCFSPTEMLHMVSIANRHQLLTTDQKRFLIGLRMAEIHIDGTYKISPEKIGKFNRIFGQFLNELKPGQRCDKERCLTCDRLQDLLIDFHGQQESAEFQRFIDWFQKSTLVYTSSESDTAVPAPPAEPAMDHALPASAFVGPFEEAPARPSPMPASPDVANGMASTAVAPAVSLVRPEAAEFFSSFSGHFPDLPLFLPNKDHPLVRQLLQLTTTDISAFPEKVLREYAIQLRQDCKQLLAALGLRSEPEPQDEDQSSVIA